MITKYKTTLGYSRIEEVSVLRETTKCVYVEWFDRSGKERRESKVGTYSRYFDTWEEAHAYFLEAAKQKVDSARRTLEFANSHYEKIKGMKAPS